MKRCFATPNSSTQSKISVCDRQKLCYVGTFCLCVSLYPFDRKLSVCSARYLYALVDTRVLCFVLCETSFSFMRRRGCYTVLCVLAFLLRVRRCVEHVSESNNQSLAEWFSG